MIALESPMLRPSSERIGKVFCSPRVSQRATGMWAPGSGRLAPVLDFLVGERPARLLAEVRDLDLPEGGEGVAHCVRISAVAAYSPMALLSDAEIEERLAGAAGMGARGQCDPQDLRVRRLRRLDQLRRRHRRTGRVDGAPPRPRDLLGQGHGHHLDPLRGRPDRGRLRAGRGRSTRDTRTTENRRPALGPARRGRAARQPFLGPRRPARQRDRVAGGSGLRRRGLGGARRGAAGAGCSSGPGRS